MLTKALLASSFSRTAKYQPEFVQAVTEVARSVEYVASKRPTYIPAFINMTEPERSIHFKVNWRNDPIVKTVEIRTQ